MITLNDIMWYSIMTADTEASGIQFESLEKKRIWKERRSAEIYAETKHKYGIR